MQVSKKEGRVLEQAISRWRETDVISEAEFDKLKASYKVTAFDWKRVAKYSFWLAISCIVIAISSALADQWLMGLLVSLFNLSDFMKSMSLAVLAVVLYFLGVIKKQRSPEKIFSNEAVFFLAVLTTAMAVAFLGMAIDNGSGHFSLLLLLAAIVYGLLGLWFPSKLVWLFSLLSLGAWFGAETGYVSGWGAYYLGMNYPLRFVVFGLVLIVLGSYLFHKWQARAEFLPTTKAVGMLYLFISLWILSLFGNYGDDYFWIMAQKSELLFWSILFALSAIVAIFHGVKYDDGMTRGFGLTFIFINLYTKFFEYFWQGTHKAIFFAILALSFWYLGTRAEKIWHMGSVKRLVKKST
ncbi:DUF2157 domain-containing protein [Reinekea thalattae]|uniref:DUF2157 domain-containing protein n=1 Tax=Reinekea thalattae TaxID=2593301 RepID=A0A5C8Z6I9_9GAMM|nr:DUF2157 domain-containing protein [Reinekea thalattae]TXR53715.1 DUF2157 domain-containing protein [Reinekea thalattae]